MANDGGFFQYLFTDPDEEMDRKLKQLALDKEERDRKEREAAVAAIADFAQQQPRAQERLKDAAYIRNQFESSADFIGPPDPSKGLVQTNRPFSMPEGKSLPTREEEDSLTTIAKMTPTQRYDRGVNTLGQYADNEAVQNYLGGLKTTAQLEKPTTGGGFSGKSKLAYDMIAEMEAMPDGPEKDAMKNRLLQSGLITSSGYGYTPAGRDFQIESGVQRIAAETPVKAVQTAATSSASARGKAIGEGSAINMGGNPQAYGAADDLRTRFENLPEMKDLKIITSNVNKARNVMKAYKEGKASPYEIDQSLAFFANKALDPGSVVMPGEFERFAKGLSGVGSLQALAAKLATGGLKLTDTERESMLGIVERAVGSAYAMAKPQYDQYKRLAEKRGVDAKDVVGGYDYIFTPKTRKRYNPATGTIEKIDE